MKPLSSSWTFFHKFIFPTIWIGLFGFVALEATFNRSPDFPLFLVAFMIGSAMLYWLGVRLKKVSLHDDKLVISNFKREIVVPLSNLDRARGSVMISPEVVWLHFKHETKFGKKIIFMPRYRVFGGFNRHPIAAELNKLARPGVGAGA